MKQLFISISVPIFLLGLVCMVGLACLFVMLLPDKSFGNESCTFFDPYQ